MASAWATANGISLRELKVNEKHKRDRGYPVVVRSLGFSQVHCNH